MKSSIEIARSTGVNLKQVNRTIERENKKFPDHPVEIPAEEWPDRIKKLNGKTKSTLKKLFRTRKFVIQVFEEPNGATRISVNRATLNQGWDYVDGISWDELFTIKNQIGYADKDCIEIYPAKEDLVNVANIRHLFILDSPHPLKWKSREDM